MCESAVKIPFSRPLEKGQEIIFVTISFQGTVAVRDPLLPFVMGGREGERSEGAFGGGKQETGVYDDL